MDEIYFGVAESLLGNSGPLGGLTGILNPILESITGSTLKRTHLRRGPYGNGFGIRVRPG